MNICQLRLLPDNTGPYFAVSPDRTLVLSVTPADLAVCQHCPNLHIRVLPRATAATVRELAHGLVKLADVLEGLQ